MPNDEKLSPATQDEVDRAAYELTWFLQEQLEARNVLNYGDRQLLSKLTENQQAAVGHFVSLVQAKTYNRARQEFGGNGEEIVPLTDAELKQLEQK